MPPVTTMAVGDSITLGQTGLQGGWRRLLNDLAPNLGMVGRNCVDGVAGYTVGQHESYGGAYVASLSAVPAQVDVYTPSLVILMLGTNDLVFDGLGSTAATLANILAFAETLAAKASVHDLLAMNIAQLPSGDPYYAATNTFRASFTATFAAASSKIFTCDPWVNTTNPSGDFADTYHPTATGYAKAVQPIYAAIVARGIQTALDRRYARRGNYRGGYV